jgi:hypothetical protein
MSGSTVGADSMRLTWHKTSPSVTSYEIELIGDSTIVRVSFDTTIAVKIPAVKTEKAYSWRIRAKNLSGFGPFSDVWSFLRLTTSVEHGESELREFTVCNNYPNPFNPSTTFSFNLPSRSFVNLRIYDAFGREAAVVISEELAAGIHSRMWNAVGMASGMYFYRLQAGSSTLTKRLVLLK